MIKINAFRSGYLKQLPLKSFVFNGGEVQVTIDFSKVFVNAEYTVFAQLENSGDIMELLVATDAIRHYDPEAKINLICPYVPYARQDRVMQPGEALSITVMARLLNAQKYSRVTIWDAHSDVTPALINNSNNIHVKDIIRTLFVGGKDNTYISGENAFLVSPDAGSIKKVSAVANQYNIPMVRADKHRDVKTGQITETIVYSDHVGDKDFLIIDDICDGGRTFIELAAKLREKTTGKVYLYVTHGIFANGIEIFEGKVDKVYCPNVFSTVQNHPLLVRL
jgi:ribose-phosphate pyrophosphokinase